MSVRIGELTAATEVYDNDKLVVEQNGQAMALPGSVFRDWLNTKIEGKGGIQSITGPVNRGGKDYYTITWTRETMPEQEFYIKEASVETFKVDYAAGVSGTNHPSSSEFKDSLDDVTIGEGEYLWTRTNIKWNSGSTETIYSVGYYGRNGTGAGTVTSVNGNQPDATGNVVFTYERRHTFKTISYSSPNFGGAFTSDATYEDYPYKLTITVGSIMTAKKHANVMFSIGAAELAAPICETGASVVTTWFSELPGADFSATVEYWT